MPTSITSSGITFDDATTLTTGVVPTANIASGAVTPAKLSQPLTLATAAPTTSGVAIDFTPIPSWVRRITVMLNGVSTNGTSALLFQVGAGSITSSGYQAAGLGSGSGTVGNVEHTTGFPAFDANGLATSAVGGLATIATAGNNVWAYSGSFRRQTDVIGIGAGVVTLSGTLDRIRLTTVNGTDTFDAGSVNIIYEG
jgi:hypothetical protein